VCREEEGVVREEEGVSRHLTKRDREVHVSANI